MAEGKAAMKEKVEQARNIGFVPYWPGSQMGDMIDLREARVYRPHSKSPCGVGYSAIACRRYLRLRRAGQRDRATFAPANRPFVEA